MIKTELCEMVGIKHPIIQAGMGPYSTNRLAAAAANTGVLGLISTSGFGYLRGNGAERESGVSELVKALTDGKGQQFDGLYSPKLIYFSWASLTN